MNPIQAILVPTDRREPTELVTINDYTDFQKHVGGTFDIVRGAILDDNFEELDISVYVHDEGLLIGLAENPRLTTITGRRLVGPGVIAGGVDSEGNTLPVPPFYKTVLDWTNEQYLKWLDAT